MDMSITCRKKSKIWQNNFSTEWKFKIDAILTEAYNIQSILNLDELRKNLTKFLTKAYFGTHSDSPFFRDYLWLVIISVDGTIFTTFEVIIGCVYYVCVWGVGLSFCMTCIWPWGADWCSG